MWIYLVFLLVAVQFVFIILLKIMSDLNKKRIKKLLWMIINFNGKNSEIWKIKELIKKCYFYPQKNELIIFFLILREKAYKDENIFENCVFTVQHLLYGAII